MRQLWFKTFWGIVLIMGLGIGAFLFPKQAEAYQGAPTPTGVTVTVTYTDPINIRSGPSTVNYPIVGQLFPGEVVPALGVSPKREWILISYPGGTGWVYASFVAISGGELQIIEPPPTPTQLATSTIDPTLAAAFNTQPTATRLPTFTPPPPLEIPQIDPVPAAPRVVLGVLILGLGLIGGIGLLVSFIMRR